MRLHKKSDTGTFMLPLNKVFPSVSATIYIKIFYLMSWSGVCNQRKIVKFENGFNDKVFDKGYLQNYTIKSLFRLLNN